MVFQGLKHFGCLYKKTVIKIDNVTPTAEVAIQLFNLRRFVVLQSSQCSPVTTTPTIDALFDIAHKHTAVALRDVFDKKVLQVAPLQRGGVLKLINHNVSEL